MLDACLRLGIEIPHSCRSGACRSCRVRRVDTPGWALACQLRPEPGLCLEREVQCMRSVRARLESRTWLSPEVLRLVLRAQADFPFQAGQYILLTREDGLTRSYSIASQQELELHVQVLPHGQMSRWLAQTCTQDTALTVRGPLGDCVYYPGETQRELILVGTGTGLAPLLGVLRQALAQGHCGPITLLHGARQAEGLYMHEQLLQHSALQAWNYEAWCLEPASRTQVQCGDLQARLLRFGTRLESARIYLCGAPALVQKLQRACFLEGAALERIHADAFGASTI